MKEYKKTDSGKTKRATKTDDSKNSHKPDSCRNDALEQRV